MTDDLMTWLGPAADELTSDQLERVAGVARDINDRYPDPDDQDKRDAALGATVQYLLGETSAEQVREELVTARARAREAYVAALQIAVLLVRDGRSKATAARLVGIDRMRLLEALGER